MTAPLLAASGVSKSFGGLTAVDAVDFECHDGEIVSVIGPNGAGKSTFFGLLSGFLHPDEGAVSWQGESLGRLAPHRRSHLGLTRTFQIPRPFAALTVLENVMAGAYHRTTDRIEARDHALTAIERFGLGDQADRPADELNVLGRKRLELARACATEPKLLLLDEVAAGLTPQEQTTFIEIVRSLNADEGITIVLVEHVLPVVRALADRLVVMAEGRVIAAGPVEETLASEAVATAYLGAQHA